MQYVAGNPPQAPHCFWASTIWMPVPSMIGQTFSVNQGIDDQTAMPFFQGEKTCLP